MLVTANDPARAAQSSHDRLRAVVPIRVAVIGCGAMTRQNLMPILSGYDRIQLTALVDLNEAAARTLADAYSVPRVLTSLDGVTRDLADAVIIATPPALHMPQAVELASRGLHLFVEKPMAMNTAEGEQIIAAAARAQATLAVGFYRRLLPSTRLLRGMLESGVMGAPRAVDIEEGGEYGWPLATLGVLTRRFGGGGVLIDIGSHVIDQLHFLLPGATRLASYADNARGGVETDAVMQLHVATNGHDIPCRIELSRTRQLRNSIRIECERGVLELPRGEFAQVRLAFREMRVEDPLTVERPVQLSGQWGDEPPPIGYQVFRNEIDDWVEAMLTGREPELSGASALSTVRLIDEAYRTPQKLAEPWTDEGLAPPRRPRAAARSTRRVLITGASGFIGCRTAEILSLRDGCDVRALVRTPANAARLARLPVDMVAGDITSPDDLAKALDGCDAVVHCAVGNSWQREHTIKGTVDGTRNVAEAAKRAGVGRFVHISSIAVHGPVSTATFDEQTPLVSPTANSYGSDKRRAEDEIMRLVGQGLPAIILRPARVYGPFGKTFITRPIQQLVRGKMALAGPFDGPSGMVYVDNVVEAIVQALECDASLVGEAFAISDPDQLSWQEFYRFFANALGAPLRLLDDGPRREQERAVPGFLGRWKDGIGAVVGSPEFRGFARKCLQTDPIGTLPRKMWDGSPALRRVVQNALGMTEATVYRPAVTPEPPDFVFEVESALVVIDKALTTLGYQPPVSRERGMALTLEWIQNSRLVPERSAAR